jgi:uncharacterized membrane protein
MDTFSTGSAIKAGWEIFKKRPGFIIGTMVVIWAASMLGSFVAGIIQTSVAPEGEIAGIVAGFAVSILIQVFVNIAYIAFFLKVHDDVMSAKMIDAWQPQHFLNFVVTTILVYIVILIGFILLVIPGIIASLALMFAPYLVIDKGMGPIEAMKESMRITKGSRLRLFALIMACMLIMFLGLLAVVVGILVAIPVSLLALMVAYRTLSAMPADAPRSRLSWGEVALVSMVGALIPLGIFSSIVLASLDSARGKAREMRTLSDMKMLQLSLELQYDAAGAFPETLDQALQPNEDSSLPSITENFTYEPTEGGQAYRLCAKTPLPEGKEQCVSSNDEPFGEF